MPEKKKFRLSSVISPDIAVLVIGLGATFLAWKIASTFPAEQIPVYVFIIGITASFLLFGMVYALGRGAKKESELEEEHSRLVSAIESVPIGLVITDLKGNVVLSNYELNRILGEPGGDWTLPMVEEKLENVYSISKFYNEVLTAHKTIDEKDLSFEHKRINIFLSPIFSEKKGILGVLILIRDVTNL